jgi:hypothetical protein
MGEFCNGAVHKSRIFCALRDNLSSNQTLVCLGDT